MTDRIGVARSPLVTVLAWMLMAAGALATPVSLISLLMIVAGSEGARSATLLGGLVVIGLPPATAVAGFGLWRRWRWAYLYVLLLLGGTAAWNVAQMLRGPTEAHTVLSADGVPTHVVGSEVDYPLHATAVLVALGALATLLARSVRAEFAAPGRLDEAPSASLPAPRAQERPRDGELASAARGWRVGHTGRDEMYYEELRDGRWQRLRISGEMLTGRAHHVIWFASPREWLAYPEWARHRRDEIVARVKSELRPPDYEYENGGPAVPAPVAPPTVPRSQWRALAVAIALLLGIAAGAAGLVAHGLASGATWLPARHGAQHRVVRVDEPATFWISIGVYAAIGVGTLGLAAWGIREGLRLRRG